MREARCRARSDGTRDRAEEATTRAPPRLVTSASRPSSPRGTPPHDYANHWIRVVRHVAKDLRGPAPGSSPSRTDFPWRSAHGAPTRSADDAQGGEGMSTTKTVTARRP